MSPRILVVDDEQDIVYTVKLILRGHEVTTAGAVADAIDQLRSTVPDLVLLDLRLPDGDGWTVLDHMRADERLAEVPVVVVSANVSDEIRTRADRAGTGYVSKPFTADDLRNAVRKAIADRF